MKRALRLAVIVSAVACGLFAQSADVRSTADISKAGMDPERLARIPARMKEFVDSGTIAGAVTLVARHGVVASLEAVGYLDLETKTPMRTDSIFQIRSMTKPITAVGIMILLEEGRLLLSDPVEKYVPEFRNQLVVDKREGEKVLTTKKPSRPITMRDLLTHTSGMPGDPSPDKLSKTLAENVATLSQEPLEFEPGTKLLYSDPGFEILGRIIEVASGQPYEKFIEQRILRPLGMKDSFFFPPPEKYNGIASAYKPQNGKLKRVEGSLNPDWQTQGPEAYGAFVASMQYARPSWGMFSTASDMAAFYQMMLNGGTYNGVRILSRASVEVMTAVHTGDLVAERWWGYGLGWGVHRERRGDKFSLESAGAYGHSGLRGTFGWVDPQEDLVGIFMIQQNRLESEEPDSVRDTFIAMTYAAIADDLKSTTKVPK
ncbi:MAG: beta-lactamase family protein [Acidobacteria bacterium]|nr:beta-lactamase family protein [Acidobacteriota bacterium]